MLGAYMAHAQVVDSTKTIDSTLQDNFVLDYANAKTFKLKDIIVSGDTKYSKNQIIRYADDIARGLDKGVKATTSGNEWIDIQNEDINKGVAIKLLQKELNIKPEECMAFGDQMNDYTLLKAVKYSYAMANAVPRIKDIAYGIAKSNDHQGVLEVIKQEVLNEL